LIYDSSQQQATWSGYMQHHAGLQEPRGGRKELNAPGINGR